ncbi:MAG TPA: helix-turn-helix transcriptional regulator [Gemmatimonadaceae bacterium]|nr:helix-turn-helix transcriptional regulator [Gemmatimonadaceae bacterium]
MDFDAHAFSTCDPDTGLSTHTVGSGIPPGLARTYLEVLYPEDLARLSMEMPRKGIKVSSLIEHSERAREAMRSYGIDEQIHVSLADGGRLWGTWCLMREKGTLATTGRDYVFLRRLAPHIARGLQTAALIDRGIADDASQCESAPGVIVLDSHNNATLRTPIAAAWIADLSDVGLGTTEEVPLSIHGLACQLRTRPDELGFELHIRARGKSGRWYMMRASLAEPDASGESAVVVVVRPAMPQEVAKLLTHLYALSLREREVVAAIARGEATKSIANGLGVSPHTVNEHIQRACDKIGVRGRKALIAKLFFDGYAPNLATPRPTIRDAELPEGGTGTGRGRELTAS